MMAEKTAMAEIEANPKPGDVPGAPGRLNQIGLLNSPTVRSSLNHRDRQRTSYRPCVIAPPKKG